MMRLAIFSIIMFALLSLGCAGERIEPREPLLELPAVSTQPYDGPPTAIAIHPVRDETARLVEVTVTAPTGGHRLHFDHGDVVEGRAMIFLTLERPAEDEVVTMALVPLRETFETERRFDQVKVHIRTHRRGEEPPTEYRLAGERSAE